MFDNLQLIAILIIAIWTAALIYYFYTARRQNEIREELEALRAKLEEGAEPGDDA